ncbi:MAG TPA: MarR family transcriptional regulator [Candidatus Saccharimonadales bacterium]|nr:MarR family transcriptional regulator [Candidatus Saccharimonadales bacterium]
MDITAEIICQDMMSLLGRFKQELARIADERGLTQVQLAAIYMVHQHVELAMGKVANVLHCDPSNVTGIVDRLVSHHLVTRQENPADRRAKTITLTDEGHKIVREIMDILPDRMGCDRLNAADRQALHTAVKKIA